MLPVLGNDESPGVVLPGLDPEGDGIDGPGRPGMPFDLDEDTVTLGCVDPALVVEPLPGLGSPLLGAPVLGIPELGEPLDVGIVLGELLLGVDGVDGLVLLVCGLLGGEGSAVDCVCG